MRIHTLKNTIASLLLLTGLNSCQKEEYTFGDLAAPSSVAIEATIVGLNSANPDGDGTGAVVISAKAQNAITYKIDFGDGTVKMVPSGKITYRYTTPGINEYTITVSAVGRAGATSILSKKIKVFVDFTIPVAILENLTGGSKKVWVCDKDADGHFGVGPADGVAPIWYAAPSNSRSADGFYNDEITFTKTPSNQVTINVDNKGETFVLGAAVSFYGLNGPEAAYPIANAGVKNLSFMNATSGIDASNSTQIQFSVPGNGLVLIGMGSNTYEILSLTSTSMLLRTIGIDGNAWYQKLTLKP